MQYSVKNGLGKCYVAKIQSEGTWDTPKELGDLIEYLLLRVRILQLCMQVIELS